MKYHFETKPKTNLSWSLQNLYLYFDFDTGLEIWKFLEIGQHMDLVSFYFSRFYCVRRLGDLFSKTAGFPN
jgi:hypothetical protein